jgi:hypothetical protein
MHKRARTDLRGGRGVIPVPTATTEEQERRDIAYRRKGRRLIGIANPVSAFPLKQVLEQPMHIRQERPWPPIDLAELRFGIAFGSIVEELADFLQRDVEEVKRKWAEIQRSETKLDAL